MDIGKSVKIALVKHGKSQKWLADKIGVSHQNINNIANNVDGNSGTFKKIAKAFDMPVSEFIALGEE